jgi:hypothetical protein
MGAKPHDSSPFQQEHLAYAEIAINALSDQIRGFAVLRSLPISVPYLLVFGTGSLRFLGRCLLAVLRSLPFSVPYLLVFGTGSVRFLGRCLLAVLRSLPFSVPYLLVFGTAGACLRVRAVLCIAFGQLVSVACFRQSGQLYHIVDSWVL